MTFTPVNNFEHFIIVLCAQCVSGLLIFDWPFMRSFEHRKQNYLRRSFHNCSGIRVVWTLVFFLEFCRSLFVLFDLFYFGHLVFCSSSTYDYDYPFGIFKIKSWHSHPSTILSILSSSCVHNVSRDYSSLIGPSFFSRDYLP
jgi:hypothetical protein